MFDEVNERGREKCRAYSEFVPPNWHSDIFWPEEDCNPLINSKDAVDFICNDEGDKPFFLTVSYYDPHPPYMAPARVTSKYCSADMVLPEYVERKNLLGNTQYKDIYQELKAEIQRNWDCQFVWE